MSYAHLINALKNSQQCLEQNCPMENMAFKKYSMTLAKKKLVKIMIEYKSGKMDKMTFEKKMADAQSIADKNAKVIQYRVCAVKHCEKATRSMAQAIVAMGKEKLVKAAPKEKKELQTDIENMESVLKEKPLDMKKLSLITLRFGR